MVVEACAKPEMSDSDEEPLILKRSSISKLNEQKSEGKQVHRQDGQTGKQVPGVYFNSNDNIQSSKPEQQAAPSYTGQSSRSKSPLLKPEESSLPDSTRTRPTQSKSGTVDDNRSSMKHPTQSNTDSDDSEDEKPLSARLGAGQSRGNSSMQIKEPHYKVKKDLDSSDDDVPLSKKYHSSPSAYAKSNEKRVVNHLSSQQNGYAKINGQHKSPTVLKKRILNSTGSSQSSAKKPKPTIGSQADDDDHFPILQRTKLVAKHEQKPLITMKETKIVSSFKKSSSNKKVTNKSQYSQSSKLQPSSGDGQKWSTLVHNAVIFPPPYKPHGVKMLYKGKPVDLSPEQEEVATMYAMMKDTEYMEKKQFKENFMNDWRKILGKKHVIQDLELCDFGPIYDWYQNEKEKKKQMTTETISFGFQNKLCQCWRKRRLKNRN